jgi:hypothetical protein
MEFVKTLVRSLSILTLLSVQSVESIAAELSTREYESEKNDIYQTVDGTIFKKTSFGYVGYLGYHEEIIFISDKEVCMNGDKYDITLYELGSSTHFSISSYEGAEAYAKYEEICGEL